MNSYMKELRQNNIFQITEEKNSRHAIMQQHKWASMHSTNV